MMKKNVLLLWKDIFNWREYMNLRLKTNSDIEIKLGELQKWLHFSSKAAVMRLAICYSLRNKLDPRLKEGSILHYDVKNQNGTDYLRSTVFGFNEELFKLLIIEYENRQVPDEEFFPEIICAHITRGVILLHSEYRFVNNRDKLMQKLINSVNEG